MSRASILPSVLAVLSLIFISSTPAKSQNYIGIFTQQYNYGRTGENRNETKLTPANVSSGSFGKLFSYTVDGQVYGEPLYVYGVNIPGKGVHNVVYVTTQMDSLYAFDADATSSTPLWQDSFIDLQNGIGPVPCGTDGNSDISCGVYPVYGITGTPVIDPSTNTMYLVVRTWNANSQTGFQMLHAIDITSGVEKFGGPVEIQGRVQGTGVGSVGGYVYFNELADIQRPALLLLKNNITGVKTVYIGWAGAAHGWIMGYDAATLAQTGIFNTTPNGERGGVWQGGNGLASDGTYIYASTGDGPFDANVQGGDYGDTVLKLDGNLNVLDYFSPMEQDCRFSTDFDLASSGPMVLPPQQGSHPSELITTGKGGSPCDNSGFAPIYLMDRTNLGGYSPTQDNIIEEVTGSPAGYWSSPAYFSVGNRAALYYAGVVAEGGTGDNMKMYTVTKGIVSSSPYSQSSNVYPIGATPSVSSNGDKHPIVWAIQRRDGLSIAPGVSPAVLYAYNASNLGNMLYDSSANPNRDQGGCGNKFAVPLVANGRVYVGTENELDIFGLLGAPPAVSVAMNHPCFAFSKQTVGTTSPPEFLTLTNTGSSTLTFSSIQVVGLNPGDFAQQNNCTTLAPGANCQVSLTITPLAQGPRAAQLIITDNAPNSPQNAQLNGKGT